LRVKIEILGTGCAKCRRMLANVQDAVKALGITPEIVKVEDITEIMNRGVMLTPALIVDGEARVVGRVPRVDEVKEILGG
jgi:small redox-active disulfide protein 2